MSRPRCLRSPSHGSERPDGDKARTAGRGGQVPPITSASESGRGRRPERGSGRAAGRAAARGPRGPAPSIGVTRAPCRRTLVCGCSRPDHRPETGSRSPAAARDLAGPASRHHRMRRCVRVDRRPVGGSLYTRRARTHLARQVPRLHDASRHRASDDAAPDRRRGHARHDDGGDLAGGPRRPDVHLAAARGAQRRALRRLGPGAPPTHRTAGGARVRRRRLPRSGRVVELRHPRLHAGAEGAPHPLGPVRGAAPPRSHPSLPARDGNPPRELPRARPPGVLAGAGHADPQTRPGGESGHCGPREPRLAGVLRRCRHGRARRPRGRSRRSSTRKRAASPGSSASSRSGPVGRWPVGWFASGSRAPRR